MKDVGKWYYNQFVAKMSDSALERANQALGGPWWKGTCWGEAGDIVVCSVNGPQGFIEKIAHINIGSGAVRLESVD